MAQVEDESMALRDRALVKGLGPEQREKIVRAGARRSQAGDQGLPVFRLKQDVVPGRTITGWFKPTKAGTYDILCAEICGVGHGVMGAKLVVENAPEHAEWQQQHANDGALAAMNNAPADSAAAGATPAAAGAR